MLDTIEVYDKLELEFPHIRFSIKEEKKLNHGVIHRFYLYSLNNVKFEKPIKTTIALLEDYYITEEEYNVIRNKMIKSFNKFKLLGLE